MSKLAHTASEQQSLDLDPALPDSKVFVLCPAFSLTCEFIVISAEVAEIVVFTN